MSFSDDQKEILSRLLKQLRVNKQPVPTQAKLDVLDSVRPLKGSKSWHHVAFYPFAVKPLSDLVKQASTAKGFLKLGADNLRLLQEFSTHGAVALRAGAVVCLMADDVEDWLNVGNAIVIKHSDFQIAAVV